MSALARNSDPHTSHEAGREMRRSGALRHQRQLALEAVCRYCAEAPRTAMELACCSGLDRYMLNRRLPELARQGRVERRRARVCLETGRKSITWAPAEQRQLTLFSKDEE